MMKTSVKILVAAALALSTSMAVARGNPDEIGYANPNFNIKIREIPYDVSYSWKNAKIFYPGQNWFNKSFTNPSIDDIKLNGKYPVVVFLHGSSGFGDDDQYWGSFLAENGFVVVAPDSYAIPSRFRSTSRIEREKLIASGNEDQIKNLKINPIKLRKIEAKYALAQLKKLPWVDTGAVFLMGHSQGGGAAGRFGMRGLAGVITSGYQCVGRVKVRVHNSVPLLALNHERDVWYANEGNPHCSHLEEFKDRVWSKEVVLPGDGHNTDYSPTARQAVLDFLNQFK
jgi:dienelactone hydrolase